MKRSKTYFGLLSLIVITLAAVACSLGTPTPQETSQTITICHATGDENNPYSALTLSLDELSAHSKHNDDIIPAPETGCPGELVPNGNDGKITICHATGDSANPYTKITMAFSGLSGHSQHENDLILASDTENCPASMLTSTPTPTITATVPDTDETPTVTPTVTITPQATGTTDEKITICHATGSKKNRYVLITVSVNGLNGHGNHKDDIIPAPAGGCPNN